MTVRKQVNEGDAGFEESGKGSQYIDWVIEYLMDDYGISLSEADNLYDKFREIIYECFVDDVNPSECAKIVWNKSNQTNESVKGISRARFVNEMYGDPYVSDTTNQRIQPEQTDSRMKDPAVVRAGDKTIDYNDEEGEVIDLFMKDNDPDLFDEIVSGEWGDDPDEYDDDTYLVNVSGPEYGHFGGPGDAWFVYSYEGAYVPE